MVKNRVLKSLYSNGDSAVDFKDGSEPIVCTIDFTNKYVKSIRRRYVQFTKDVVLVFSWTDNKYILLACPTIQRITPLSKLLNN